MSVPPTEGHTNPFPGLRPFRQEEEFLFFGREWQVDSMVDKLARNHFLAVVGTSGSGKSSLVNCGLGPALHRGLMAEAGTSWKIVQFQPGIDPMGRLSAALAEDNVLFRNYGAGRQMLLQVIGTTIRMSKLGLIDIFEQARLPAGTNLLVIVDQFEELFRYAALTAPATSQLSEMNEDAVAFVNLLIEIREHPHLPIYVVLTMRSDFLGDCAKFQNLPEAINAGQYLVPRLTRDQLRSAIAGPVQVTGAEISIVLVTRLVNEVGDNPDQLSVLQHALNRTWSYWRNKCGGAGPIDLQHYEAIGTMSGALDAHADRAYAELDTEGQREICRKIFMALTDKATDQRGVRRPTKFSSLCAIAQADPTEAARTIDVFRRPGRSFLMPAAKEELTADTVVDISHESLMRNWQRLRVWADEEARSARLYGRLAKAAELHATGEASTWRNPELQLTLNWVEREQPTADWAEQYGGGFDRTKAFLGLSVDALDRESRERRAEKQSRKRLKQAGALAVFLIALVAAYYWRQKVEAESGKLTAEGNAIAQDVLSEALTGDPVAGSLLAIEHLRQRSAADASAGSLERALWHAHSRTQLSYVLKDHRQELRSIAFDRHGSLLATGSFDGKAIVYETGTWQVATVIDENAHDGLARDSRVLGVQFTPDGKLLATASSSLPTKGDRIGRARLWDPKSGKQVRDFVSGPDGIAHYGPVRTVAFSSSGERLVTSSYDNTARIWNVRTGRLERILEGHQVGGSGVDVYDAVFHPNDSSTVATVGNDGMLRVWDFEEEAPFHARPHGHEQVMTKASTHRELGGHEETVRSVVFSPDGRKLLTASDDDTIRLWNWEQGVQDGRPLEAHSADIWRAIFDPAGKRIITGGWDRSVAIWDSGTFNLLATLRGHTGPIRTVAYDLFGARIASGGEDRTARVWNLEADDVRLRLKSHEANVTAVRVNPAVPEEFATASDDGTIRIWKVGERIPFQILEDERLGCQIVNWRRNCGVDEIAYSGDGTRLAARYVDGSMRVWSITSGSMAGPPIEGVQGEYRAIVALSTSGQFAVGTRSGEIRFFSDRDGAAGKTPPINVTDAINAMAQFGKSTREQITTLAYDPARKLLAAGLERGVVLIWDMSAGQLVAPIVMEGGSVTSLRFARDGKMLFVASWDWTITGWKVSRDGMSRMSAMRGHRGEVHDLDIVGDGRLVSASDDETVRVWDTSSGQEIVSLPGHIGTVRSISVVPDRNLMITGSDDDTVLIRSVFENINGLRTEVCRALHSKNLTAGGYPVDGAQRACGW